MNVRYFCEVCDHTVFAPPDTEPPCRENKGKDCEMEQKEDFPAKVPKKVTTTSSSGTKKEDDKHPSTHKKT
jgi:hypothetical protein